MSQGNQDRRGKKHDEQQQKIPPAEAADGLLAEKRARNQQDRKSS